MEPDGDRTRLTYTEQGVHFDGLDSVEGREEGSGELLDQLGSFLTPAPEVPNSDLSERQNDQ